MRAYNTDIRHILLTIVLFLVSRATIQAQNTDYAVGSIPGAIDVSPTGAATYSIPIEVVPGTQGMQPNLAIAYSSQSGMGLLGMKWHLSGLSMITRTPKVEYFDNRYERIMFTPNDEYALDGNRLLRNSTTSNLYYPEIENFSVIERINEQNGIDCSFLATLDGGTKMYYGGYYDTRQYVNNGILSWMIDRVENANGNHIHYRYGQHAGEIWPVSIEYGGNESLGKPHYAKVEFTYITDNVSQNTYFVSGNGTPHTKLLKEIRVFYQTELARKYVLVYEQNRTARLKEVILYSATGERLNSTTINWEAQNNSIQTETLPLPESAKMAVGDFNGDGKTDIIYHNILDANNSDRKWKLYLNNGDGTYSSNAFGEGTHAPDNTNHLAYVFTSFFAADFTGDGKDELMILIKTNESYAYRIIYFDAFGAIENSFVQTVNGAPLYDVLFGDFDGNGKCDVLFLQNTPEDDELQIRAYNINLYNSTFPASLTSSLSDYGFRAINSDQSGKHSFLVLGKSNTFIFNYSTTSRQFELVGWPGFPLSYHILYPGDFNGDGITDLLFYIGNGTCKWHIVFGKGDGDYTWPVHELPTGNMLNRTASVNGKEPQYPVLIADLDGDGKDDILQPIDLNNNGNVSLKIYKSKGCINNQYQYSTQTYSNPSLSNDDLNLYYHLGDFNGDGKADVLFKQAIWDQPVVFYFNKNEKFELVSSITDGLNNSIQFTYTPKYINSFYYTSALLKKQKQFTYLVNTLKTPIGHNGEFLQYTYTFSSPVFSPKKRTFLGFQTITKSTYNQQETIESYLESSKELLRPLRTTVEANRKTIVTFTEYQTINVTSKRFYAYFPVQTVTNDFDQSKTTITTEVYTDSQKAGRVKKVIKKIAPIATNATPLMTEETHYTYESIVSPNSANQWVPQSILSKSYLNNNASLSINATTSYTYANGRVSSISQTDAEGTVTTNYQTYDAVGNPTKISIGSSGLTTKIDQYTYDATGRFVTSHKDPKSYYTYSTYDPKTGNVLSTTDINNLITTFQYDAFGRETVRTHPDGTQTKTFLSWNSSPNYIPATYEIRTWSTGQISTTIYYDRLGREVSQMGKYARFDTRYNAYGEVEKVSQPYTGISTPDANKTWTCYTYDNLGRIVEEVAPQKHLTYTYHGLTTSTHDELRDVTYSKTHDAAGRVVSATDPGGTITYGYALVNISGKIRSKQEIALHGNSTTIITDSRGNRLSLNEPNAGEITSTYNAYGQMTSQTDANGNYITYTYDVLGRTLSRVVANPNIDTVTTTYTYDRYTSTSRGRGKLYAVQENGVMKKGYTYDPLGRVSQESTVIDQTPYHQTYTYTTTGQVDEIEYPDHFTIKHIYNDVGQLQAIQRTDNNDYIYRIYSRNNLGQVTKSTFGNSTGTEYSYNAFGQVTKIKTGNKVFGPFEPRPFTTLTGTTEAEETEENTLLGTTGLPVEQHFTLNNAHQELTYEYNALGLMSKRSNLKNGQSEVFRYDPLDRLIGFSPPNTMKTRPFVYSNTGNLVTHPYLGTLSYEGTKPHAVTSISLSNNSTIPTLDCAVEYNTFHQPTSITEERSRLLLYYGADGQREKTVFTSKHGGDKTKYFVSSLYEKEVVPNGATRHLNYIYGETGLVAILVKSSDAAGDLGAMYYIHTDHLGSYNLITNENRIAVDSFHFDPWGNRRLYNNWAANDTRTSFLFDRGFTGHEHLDVFKIINMNGRLYDPVIARFFSPDNYVANANFTQDFNRYSYCRNNPLMYTDPSGEFIWVPMLIGAVVAATSYTVSVATSPGGFQNWNWGQFALSTMTGMVTGAFSYGIGSAVGGALSAVGISGMAGGAISGFASGAVTGTINGLVNYAMSGDASAIWKSTLTGSGMGAITGAITGMTNALKANKNVWLGRDIAMGRSAWSFKNTDLAPTSFWEDISGPRNTTRISDALKQKNKANSGQENRWYRTEYGKDGYSKLVENPISIARPERTIYVGNMQGRGELMYSGWVEDGFSLQYTFDENSVLTLSPGNYSETIISIPSGTQYVNVRLVGNLPSYFNNASEIYTGFFKTVIYGIPR